MGRYYVVHITLGINVFLFSCQTLVISSCMIVFASLQHSEMTLEPQDHEQEILVHQTPLQCEFEVKSRSFEECPIHDRYLWIF